MFAEVDGLAPRRGPDLREAEVDEHDAAVGHEEVRGLHVAVREPGVPEHADRAQAVVDDGVVDLDPLVADLARVGGEVGDEHVLASRRDLDEAVRPHHRRAGVAEHPHQVVLVLDESLHARERPLVLEPSVRAARG